MSTKVGIISEGPIDHLLLPPLLSCIAKDKVGFNWPVTTEDVSTIFRIRKRGHGGVLETVRKLINALNNSYYDFSFILILLDRNTKQVQTEIKQLIAGKGRFVFAIAIEEIEAWWLGDRTNTLAWSGLKGNLPPDCRYADPKYKAEHDDDPKITLDEITRSSNHLGSYYGQGNTGLADDFIERYWKQGINLKEISRQCPCGYGSFERDVINRFRQAQALVRSRRN